MGRSTSTERVTRRLEDRLDAARGLLGGSARDLLVDAGGRARDTAEVARDRGAEMAAELTDTVEPRARELGAAVAGGARTAVSSLSFLPAVLSQVLTFLAGLTGGLAERGREAAYRIEPPASVRRRSRLRTVLWFLGGFGAGTATGWLLHARMQEPPASAGGYPVAGEETVGDPTSPIDARRERARLP
jgi:hypothetical protein